MGIVFLQCRSFLLTTGTKPISQSNSCPTNSRNTPLWNLVQSRILVGFSVPIVLDHSVEKNIAGIVGNGRTDPRNKVAVLTVKLVPHSRIRLHPLLHSLLFTEQRPQTVLAGWLGWVVNKKSRSLGVGLLFYFRSLSVNQDLPGRQSRSALGNVNEQRNLARQMRRRDNLQIML